jgi:hypothetical protein
LDDQRRIVLSFDIDGTLETGDPPGRVTMDMVKKAQEMGYIIGSASDKPVPVQKMIWEKFGIKVEFTIHKQKLDEIKALIEADVYQHIGDTNMDEHYAILHGFEFIDVFTAEEPWMQLPDGSFLPPGEAPMGRYGIQRPESITPPEHFYDGSSPPR